MYYKRKNVTEFVKSCIIEANKLANQEDILDEDDSHKNEKSSSHGDIHNKMKSIMREHVPLHEKANNNEESLKYEYASQHKNALNKISNMEEAKQDKWVDELSKIFLPALFVGMILLPAEIAFLQNNAHLIWSRITSVCIFIIALLAFKYITVILKNAAKIKMELNAIRAIRDEYLEDYIRSLLHSQTQENDYTPLK